MTSRKVVPSVSQAVLAACVALVGCTSSTPGTDTGGQGGGGEGGESGMSGDAGASGTGGAVDTGGSGTGGVGTGGATTTGGATATGGAVATGGAGGAGTGGSAGRGGTGTGGSAGSAGTPGTAGSGGRGGIAPLTGTPGVWQQVTPAGVNLTSDFGAMDVLADPAKPGVFYAFVCLQGVYKSTDWGATWTHVSTDGNLEKGRPWGQAIAPDGSYLLASSGYPSNGNQGAWKSTDGGVTWKPYSISQDNDPYNFDIDPANKNHVITAMHNKDNIYESMDGGQTWTDKGSSGAGGSNYVFFITSTTWIAIGQDGSGTGTRRTTNSGGNWANVGPMEHAHGNAQIFFDPANGHVYAAGHNNGVYRSTNAGASFSQVSNVRGSTVFATGTRIYSMDPGANAAGTAPMPQSTARSAGTSWAAFAVPAAMTNGAKRAATAHDAASGRWVIVSGNWNAGFWRYIEPQ